MRRPLPPLMVVTDRRATRGRPLPDVIVSACRGGARLFQLREKDLDDEMLLATASELRAITRTEGALLLVNGAVDVAQAVGADGVVLPESSMATAEARVILGLDRWIGRSTHSPAAVARARYEGADFALFGPVFETPSKAAFGAPQGLERLRKATGAGLPVYAVGGISASNVAAAVSAKAAGIAVIREVMSADDPERASAVLVRALSEFSR